MKSFQLRCEMGNQFDIAAYSPNRELVLLVEVKWSKDSSQEGAVFFRRNLRNHGMLTDGPHFLLANRNNLFLWKGSSGPDAEPDFRGPAKPVLKKYLGDIAETEVGAGPESVELAFKLWLTDLARGSQLPDPESAADRMLVDSGLYQQIKGGEVRRESTE
jgi:hypothetical protein